MKTSLLGLVVAALTADAAVAQPNRNCAPRERVVTMLAEKYQESRRSIGLATQGRVMEVYASEESGSWSIVVTLPNGVTCLVASGQAFEEVDDALQPAGTRS